MPLWYGACGQIWAWTSADALSRHFNKIWQTPRRKKDNKMHISFEKKYSNPTKNRARFIRTIFDNRRPRHGRISRICRSCQTQINSAKCYKTGVIIMFCGYWSAGARSFTRPHLGQRTRGMWSQVQGCQDGFETDKNATIVSICFICIVKIVWITMINRLLFRFDF